MKVWKGGGREGGKEEGEGGLNNIFATKRKMIQFHFGVF